MKRILFVCASGAAMMFGMNAFAGETAAAEAVVETPAEGAPVQELTDPTAEAQVTVEGEVAPEGEGDIDAEAAVEGEAAAEEPTAEAAVAAEGEAAVEAAPDPQ